MKYVKAPLRVQAPFKKKYGTRFKAGQRVYKIVWCMGIVIDERNAYGCCNYEERAVYIDITKRDIQETLIHEMFHAECYECGMSQVSAFHPDLEELCCEVASRVARNFDVRKKR